MGKVTGASCGVGGEPHNHSPHVGLGQVEVPVLETESERPSFFFYLDPRKLTILSTFCISALFVRSARFKAKLNGLPKS